jgi:hypothetical protein
MIEVDGRDVNAAAAVRLIGEEGEESSSPSHAVVRPLPRGGGEGGEGEGGSDGYYYNQSEEKKRSNDNANDASSSSPSSEQRLERYNVNEKQYERERRR